MRLRSVVAGLSLALSFAVSVQAAQVQVAVAANFAGVLEELAAAFKAKTGDELVISSAATGALYNQIAQGAPFEIFLAADNKRPAQAVTEGYGVAGTVFTYAAGKVVLYSTVIDVTNGEAVLRAGDFAHISVADAKTAPYGVAAMETIDALGATDVLAPKIVTGESIAQTILFVESGSADLGFVALSQVIGKPATSVWTVPPDLYSPILQDAVLLKTGEDNPVAVAFLEFLRNEEAAAIISQFGYVVD
jgi:molybdate transport system substrate-binding protein